MMQSLDGTHLSGINLDAIDRRNPVMANFLIALMAMAPDDEHASLLLEHMTKLSAAGKYTPPEEDEKFPEKQGDHSLFRYGVTADPAILRRIDRLGLPKTYTVYPNRLNVFSGVSALLLTYKMYTYPILKFLETMKVRYGNFRRIREGYLIIENDYSQTMSVSYEQALLHHNENIEFFVSTECYPFVRASFMLEWRLLFATFWSTRLFVQISI
jgi:hypothetical protein